MGKFVSKHVCILFVDEHEIIIYNVVWVSG